MSVLITQLSVQQSALNILQKNYAQKLNVTTIKGKTSCHMKKTLLNFMMMQVIANEEILMTTDDCECMKEEFDFTQDCVPPVPPPETYFRIDGEGDFRIDGDGNFRIYQ